MLVFSLLRALLFPGGFSEDKGQRQLLTILRSKSAYDVFSTFIKLYLSHRGPRYMVVKGTCLVFTVLVREDLLVVAADSETPTSPAPGLGASQPLPRAPDTAWAQCCPPAAVWAKLCPTLVTYLRSGVLWGHFPRGP